MRNNLKGQCHEILRGVLWPVWIDLGLNKDLFWFLIFSASPPVLGGHFSFPRGSEGFFRIFFIISESFSKFISVFPIFAKRVSEIFYNSFLPIHKWYWLPFIILILILILILLFILILILLLLLILILILIFLCKPFQRAATVVIVYFRKYISKSEYRFGKPLRNGD